MKVHIIIKMIAWVLLILVLGAAIYALGWYIWFRGHYIHQLWLAGRWPALWE